MKSIIFILIIPAIISAQDFRGVSWGMKKDQVKSIEKTHLIHDGNDALLYEDYIASRKVKCIYFFKRDTLNGALYSLDEKHSNDNLYFDDYDAFKSALIKKYGEPEIDQCIWSRDLYKNDFSRRGFAVSIGDLKCTASWTYNNTRINLVISGDNYEANVRIVYIPKDRKITDENADKL